MSGPVDVRAEWLTIAGDPEAWRSIGLTVTDDGQIPLLGTSLRLIPPSIDHPRLRQEVGDPVHGNLVTNVDFGLTGWALSGLPGDVTAIDGLHTDVVERAEPVLADHPLGASSLDHVVVLTPDLERTRRGDRRGDRVRSAADPRVRIDASGLSPAR